MVKPWTVSAGHPERFVDGSILSECLQRVSLRSWWPWTFILKNGVLAGSQTTVRSRALVPTKRKWQRRRMQAPLELPQPHHLGGSSVHWPCSQISWRRRQVAYLPVSTRGRAPPWGLLRFGKLLFGFSDADFRCCLHCVAPNQNHQGNN